MRRLPPLSSLRAFEAAARHLSFKRAAEELAVTPTAVSHQIRTLEEFLQIRLFERRTRQVIMTPEAQLLYPALRDGFDAIATAIEALTRTSKKAAATLTATRAFTVRWLAPRLARFQTRRPDVMLHLIASDEVVDIAAGGADLAIRYGGETPAGLRSETLMVDAFAPVAHRSLDVNTIEDLTRFTLIHSDWHVVRPDQPTWANWLRAAGVSGIDPNVGMRFNDESHAIQAVVAGLGVGLVSSLLIADDLETGALVRPFGPELEGREWRLVERLGPSSDAVTAVREWLLDEFRRPTPSDETG